jgi:hypothetical protein
MGIFKTCSIQKWWQIFFCTKTALEEMSLELKPDIINTKYEIWGYSIECEDRKSTPNIITLMNHLGALGWEAYAVIEEGASGQATHHLFKRLVLL